SPDVSRVDLFRRQQKDVPPALTIPGDIEELSCVGLVIIGEPAEARRPLAHILNQGNIIAVRDPSQNVRTILSDAVVNHDMMFSNFDEDQFNTINDNLDFIIRIGEPVTSKQTNAVLK